MGPEARGESQCAVLGNPALAISSLKMEKRFMHPGLQALPEAENGKKKKKPVLLENLRKQCTPAHTLTSASRMHLKLLTSRNKCTVF